MQNTAFDLDGVICDTHNVFRLEFLKKYGWDINTPPKRSGKITYKIHIPNVKDKDIGQIIYETIVSKWKDTLPYNDAQEALNLFYSYYRRPVTIVTARSDSLNGVIDATNMWLKANFPTIEFEVFYKNHKNKAIFLKESKFDTFVEDRLQNANEVSECVRRVFLINRLWNVGRETKPKVIRVSSLKQAVISILEGV